MHGNLLASISKKQKLTLVDDSVSSSMSVTVHTSTKIYAGLTDTG